MMMRRETFLARLENVTITVFKMQIGWRLALLLGAPLLTLTLAAQQGLTLIVSGQQGSLSVFQQQGHNYVDIDGLARLTSGSISYNGNRIVLTLPGIAGAGAGNNSAAISQDNQGGFSKAFLTAGVEYVARIREWHSALRTAIERGVPLNTGWLDSYQAQARESLNLASVAVNNDSDRNGYQLLLNVFNNMKALTNEYVQLNNSQTYFAPDSLQSDSLDQSIVACGHSLAAMAAARQFIDDGSCQ